MKKLATKLLISVLLKLDDSIQVSRKKVTDFCPENEKVYLGLCQYRGSIMEIYRRISWFNYGKIGCILRQDTQSAVYSESDRTLVWTTARKVLEELETIHFSNN